MPNITKDGIEYELVSTVADNLSSSNVLRTIVGEGETSVNTFRLNLPSWNPMTGQAFSDAEQIEQFCKKVSHNFWSPYWEDPAPEGGE
tara:strand:- start:3677 stop:3940 length:264 start_codon:yes stop_codon:yes gene_type:complete